MMAHIRPKHVGHHNNTRGMSKLSLDRLNFARKGHETVALAHSYFANIPEGLRYVLLAVEVAGGSWSW